MDEESIHTFLRHGTAGIAPEIEQTMKDAAKSYTQEIFRKLREHGYDPRLRKLYVVGGGGCLIKNFCQYDRSRITICDDICATAKGYEYMAGILMKGGK